MFKKIKRAYKILQELEPETFKPETKLGDGKAEFFGDVTDKEMDDYEKEQNGTLAWYERLKRL